MASNETDWALIHNVLQGVIRRVDLILQARGIETPTGDLTEGQLREFAREAIPPWQILMGPDNDVPPTSAEQDQWAKEMGPLQVIPEPAPPVVHLFGVCVMCYAEKGANSPVTPAVFIACGHSVCLDHVDEVLEAGQ